VILTKGYVSIIDTTDLAVVARFKWHANSTKDGEIYAARNQQLPCGKKKLVFLHRAILQGDSVAIDHVNGDKLDNRRANLRPCTHSQNLWNSKISKRNKSGYKGVVYHKTIKKWIAQISSKYLGAFETPEKAAMAYNKAALEIAGEFARINELKEEQK
jgi:hypothetical protein